MERPSTPAQTPPRSRNAADGPGPPARIGPYHGTFPGVPRRRRRSIQMNRFIASITLSIVLAACGAQAAPPAPSGTGIQGLVQSGPTCPVERINSPCPPRPLAATIVVRDASGREVARTHSGADGHFKVDVAPGTYTVVGLNIGSSMLPRPIPTTATVTSGSYTAITVEYDSGIR